MGASHGLYCLGCCWALMLLLFVGGVMNLLWIAAIAFFVLLEKVLPLGRVPTWVAGVAMIGAGLALLIRGAT
jgi:predicted metal-binding membrane protein